MCDRIVAELRERKFPYPCEHVSYPGAGHGFRPPYLPSNKETARGPIFFGGKPADNARACREYWAQLIRFFSSNDK
jgi:dienelactone hydrolase